MPTAPRMIVAGFAPITPKETRATTGKGMPRRCEGRPIEFISWYTARMPASMEAGTCQPVKPKKDRPAAKV